MNVSPQPAATTLAPAQIQKIAATAQQFEAMALGALFAPMFDTVDTAHGSFGGGEAEAAWRPMMITELAKAVSKQGGMGLARPVMEQMIRIQENAK